jgi:serine phosphatase RsbU (regulator of sigma subunit)
LEACEELGGHGIPIGILPYPDYPSASFSFNPSVLVVIHTGRIANAMNSSGEMIEEHGI